MITTAPVAYLRLFGGVSLEGDEGPVVGRGAQRRRIALLALLATNPRSLSRDKVIAYLWEDAETDRARKLLSESLYVLRKALGEDAILAVGDELQLNRAVLSCDVWEFTSAIERGDDEAAVAVYHGPFLDGFFLSDAAEFEKWVDGERDAYARARANALVRLATKSEQAHDFQGAATCWRKLAEQDPYNAAHAIGLMRALDALGDRAAAIQHARVHATMLREEFDADPDPGVESLAQQLRDAPRSAPAQLPAATAAVPEVRAAPLPPRSVIAETPARSPRRSRTRLVVAAALVLLVCVGVAAGLMLRRPPAAAAQTALLAVLPFSVHGPAEELRDGMVELLSANLDGAGDLRAVDPHAVLSISGSSAAMSPRRALNIAQRFGATYFVLGDVVQAGQQLQIDAWLYDHRSGNSIAHASTRGNADSLLVLVDRLATQLLTARGLSAGELNQLAAHTTHSYAALKKYLEGESAYRAGRYNAAEASFLAALHDDPRFALAQYRLSAAAEWNFDFLLARRAARDALANSDRLADHYQQLVNAWWYFLNGNALMAQRTYETVLANYPADVEARSGLGEVFAHFNPIRGLPGSQARDAFNRVLAVAPAFGEVRYHSLEFAARDRNRERFEALLADLPPTNQQYPAWSAVHAFEWGDAAEQAAIVRKLRNRDELVVGLAAARLAQTMNLDGAEVVAHELSHSNRTDSWRAGGRLLLAEILLAQGRWPEARTEIEQARAVEPDWSRELEALFLLHPSVQASRQDLTRMRDDLLAWRPSDHSPSLSFFLAVHATIHKQLRAYLLGLLEARLGNFAQVETYRRELEHLSGDADAQKVGVAFSQSLAGHSAFGRGDKAKARELLAAASIAAPPEYIALSPFYSRAADRFLLGDINRDLGNSTEAARWYSSLLDGYDFAYAPAARSRLQQLQPGKR